MAIKRIDHIAIVVPDADEAASFYRDTLGLPLSHVETVEGQAVKVAFFPLAGGEIELVEPVTADSGVAQYLEKRGAGMHHLCLEVDDIDAALDTLKRSGADLIDDKPAAGSGGTRVAFLHPRSTYGVLIELVEKPNQPAQKTQEVVKGVALWGRAFTAGWTAFWRTLLQRGPLLHPRSGITLKAEGEMIEVDLPSADPDQ